MSASNLQLSHYCPLTATEVIAYFAEKKLDPVEIIKTTFSIIDKFNPLLNAFNYIDKNAAIKSAIKSRNRWQKGQPLSNIDGLPISIKDCIQHKKWPSLCASKANDANQPWEIDSSVVSLLKNKGAIIIGKTTMPEFGYKGVTDSLLNGITRNPWDLKYTPGGSSGGAAVATATSMGIAAIGTDAAGSIRIPASFTGIFGIKPTHGLIPDFPPGLLGSLHCVGPLTKTVVDAALLLDHLIQYDKHDPYSIKTAPAYYLKKLNILNLKNLKIAYRMNYEGYPLHGDVKTAFLNALKLIAPHVQIISEVNFETRQAEQIIQTFWLAKFSHCFHEFDRDKQALFSSGLIKLAKLGQKISLYEYANAELKKTELTIHMQSFFQDYDILLTPTLLTPPFCIGQDAPNWPEDKLLNWTPFTSLFNLTGQPAASIPCGFSKAGLPIGMQIAAPRFCDLLVLQFAHFFEQLMPIQLPEVTSLK